MTKIFVTAAALIGASLSTPVLAQPQYAVSGNAASQQQAAPARSNANSSERQICVRMELTGTRVARRICRTAAEWERSGGVPESDR